MSPLWLGYNNTWILTAWQRNPAMKNWPQGRFYMRARRPWWWSHSQRSSFQPSTADYSDLYVTCKYRRENILLLLWWFEVWFCKALCSKHYGLSHPVTVLVYMLFGHLAQLIVFLSDLLPCQSNKGTTDGVGNFYKFLTTSSKATCWPKLMSPFWRKNNILWVPGEKLWVQFEYSLVAS